MNPAPPDAADALDSSADVVLIVDDVPDNISLLNDALDDAGYTVLVASSGEAAARAELGPDLCEAVQEPQAAGGAGGGCGEGAEHGGGLHMML